MVRQAAPGLNGLIRYAGRTLAFRPGEELFVEAQSDSPAQQAYNGVDDTQANDVFIVLPVKQHQRGLEMFF